MTDQPVYVPGTFDPAPGTYQPPYYGGVYAGLADLIMLAMVAFLFASPILSAIVAGSKGRDKTGWFMLGLVFGPLGLLAAVGVSDNRRDE